MRRLSIAIVRMPFLSRRVRVVGSSTDLLRPAWYWCLLFVLFVLFPSQRKWAAVKWRCGGRRVSSENLHEHEAPMGATPRKQQRSDSRSDCCEIRQRYTGKLINFKSQWKIIQTGTIHGKVLPKRACHCHLIYSTSQWHRCVLFLHRGSSNDFRKATGSSFLYFGHSSNCRCVNFLSLVSRHLRSNEG